VSPLGTRCALITPATIHSDLGSTVARPIAGVNRSTTLCTYRASDLAQSVLIRYDSTATTTSFDQERALFRSKGDLVGKINGLGDEAYYVVATAGGKHVNTVVARRGSEQVLVTGTTGSLTQFEVLASAALSDVAPAAGGTSTTATTATTAG
jgi:hypothetical protein